MYCLILFYFSQYLKTPAIVHFVEGNHYTILENIKAAELIQESSLL